jgi:sialic acid synthase SpsE
MHNIFFVDGKAYSSQNPLIIAELGTSHGGDWNKALEMVKAAAEAGADCVKLQIVFVDEILHPNTGEVALPGGEIRLYDRFRQLEKPLEFYAGIKEYAESLGLLFLCTPFGLKSAKLLHELQPKLVKIASPELNFTALLREIADWGLPILLSTGVSTLGDIEEAVSILGTGDWGLGTGDRKIGTGMGIGDQGSGNGGYNSNHRDLSQIQYYHPNNNPSPQPPVPSPQSLEAALPHPQSLVPSPQPLILLHCVTAYPAPETDYNLRVLKSLSSVFGLAVGISDHSLDPELVPALAVSQGAAVIEKHFCLSRSDPGLDDPIALPPADFARMVKAARHAAQMEPEKLTYLNQHWDAVTIEKVLGKGIKSLAPSERENYSRTNRSIHALRDIQPGKIIAAEDFAVLRTEKILRPGLAPSWADKICGRAALNFIPAGEGIRFEDV